MMKLSNPTCASSHENEKQSKVEQEFEDKRDLIFKVWTFDWQLVTIQSKSCNLFDNLN